MEFTAIEVSAVNSSELFAFWICHSLLGLYTLRLGIEVPNICQQWLVRALSRYCMCFFKTSRFLFLNGMQELHCKTQKRLFMFCMWSPQPMCSFMHLYFASSHIHVLKINKLLALTSLPQGVVCHRVLKHIPGFWPKLSVGCLYCKPHCFTWRSRTRHKDIEECILGNLKFILC